MAELDTRYVPLGQIQEQFWDKLTGAPLAGGELRFFKDIDREEEKAVYALSGNPPEYDVPYPSIGTKVTLSAIGTTSFNGANTVVYLYPYDDTGSIELYHIEVWNAQNQFQFTVSGVPNVPVYTGSITPTPIGEESLDNLIQNSQFSIKNITPGPVTAIDTNIAYPTGALDGWHYIRATNNATESIGFFRFDDPINSPTSLPSGNPRDAFELTCTLPSIEDTYKGIEYRFKDVNRFSDVQQQLSLRFEGASNGSSSQDVELYLYKNFGTGGSPAETTPLIITETESNTATLLKPVLAELQWRGFESIFNFGSNAAPPFTIGPNDDDYFSIRVMIKDPGTSIPHISVTSFVLLKGGEAIGGYPMAPTSVNDQKINDNETYINLVKPHVASFFEAINVQVFNANGTYTPSAGMKYCKIECWGAGGGGAGARVENSNQVGGGGGGGGYSYIVVTAATIGLSQTVTIGTGGTGGNGNPTGGGSGGNTTVASLCIALGAAGGLIGSATYANGGLGGGLGTGDFTCTGCRGQNGMKGVYFEGGEGGSSGVGSGGAPGIVLGSQDAGVSGFGGKPYGGGGGAGSAGGPTLAQAGSGGAGANGYVVITEYINNL